MNPMVSVVIPLFNKANSIDKCLASVLSQTFTNLEVVVVDDGSTDHSAHLVEKGQDARVKLIRQKNGGVSAARNRGILSSKGEYVAFLDADDYWHPQHLQTLLDLVEKYQNVSTFFTHYHFLQKTETPAVWAALPETEDGLVLNYFESVLKGDQLATSSGVMVKKRAFDATGLFKEGEQTYEDQSMWARLSFLGMAYSKKTTYIYNRNHSALSAYSARSSPPAFVNELMGYLNNANLRPDQKWFIKLFVKSIYIGTASENLLKGKRWWFLKFYVKGIDSYFTKRLLFWGLMFCLPLNMPALVYAKWVAKP